MFKLLGQSLALVAMIASVLNAQCAVSCSLQSITQLPSSEPSGIDLNQEQHSCCPHGAPKPKEQKHQIPCPEPLPAASKDRAENGNASSDSILAMVVVSLSYRFELVISHTFLEPRLPSSWLSQSQTSSTSLRI